MRVSWRVTALALTTPLRIARGSMGAREAVEVSLTDADGVRGYGEVVTSVRLGLDVAGIARALEDSRPALAAAGDGEQVLAVLAAAPLPAGVRAALDAAAHDLLGVRAGCPVYALPRSTSGAAGDAPDRPANTLAPVATARTIGIGDPRDAADQARQLCENGFRVLKVKAGDAADIERLTAVRTAAPDSTVIADANGAWTADRAVRILNYLPWLDAVEQPVAPGAPETLAWVSERSSVPVIADEDAATAADVRGLAGAVAGVNVKLAECGGLDPARAMLAAARHCGLEIMLGCLVASSLGIAPAVHLTRHARWVDLDGHLLLAHDPWTGIGGHDGLLRPDHTPGLGVRRVAP
ncbi:enolase C-terminal domain-like protein [Nocardia asteroides]|uniref:enolase C-terminal domain-like protein n=1 Tax=Nocardia asteroides TaxID=1824 RepID=UPI001E3DE4AD|nr:enolase C-terminal domain-like protein [Nocardia asteroides]UGT63088.1 peptide epimerase [Nocardia asteroides]